MDPIPLDPTVQPQPEQYPPGSAIPVDTAGNVIPPEPGSQEAPPPEESPPKEEPQEEHQKEEKKEKPKQKSHKKKL